MRHQPPVRLLLLASSLLASAAAQNVIQALPTGVPVGDSRARAIGDWNRDGRDDFAVAARLPLAHAASLVIVSGRDASVLASFGNGATATADLDGDGAYEVVHSHAVYGPGVVDVRTTSGVLLFSLPVPAGSGSFGAEVRVVGDLDRDGVRDLCVAGPSDERVGRVHAFSGRNGSPLFSFGAADPRELFGFDLQAIADVDGDLVDDLVVGQHASAGVYSGSDGRHLHELGDGDPRAYAQWYGTTLDVVGDVDGDAIPDVVVGCEFGDTARLCSGRTGQVVHELHSPRRLDRFGVAVAGIGDADGDGVPDVAIGGYEVRWAGYSDGYVTVVSGRTGTAIFTVPGPAANAAFGRTVSAIPDLDGDGRDDFVVGTTTGAPLLAISAKPQPLCSDRHLVSTQAGGMQSLTLAAGSEHAGNVYLVLGSISGTSPGFELGEAHVPLNVDPWLTASAAYANTGPFLGTLGVLDAAGRASAGIVVPPLPQGFVGLRFDHAFVTAPIGGAVRTASNAVPLTLWW